MLYAVEGMGLFVPYPKGTPPIDCTWSYRGGNGLAAGGTSATEPLSNGGALLPPGGHSLPSDALFDFRVLTFSHLLGQEIVSVTITKFYLITSSSDTARNLIGFNEAELSDNDLDFVGAALELDISVQGAFRGLLASSLNAQRLLLLHTVLKSEQSLANRMAQKMSSDAVSFSRYSNVDLRPLLDELRRERDTLLNSVLGQSPEVLAPRTVFTLSTTRTDPFSES